MVRVLCPGIFRVHHRGVAYGGAGRADVLRHQRDAVQLAAGAAATFKDTTDARDNVSYNYHDYDLPYGYSDQGVPGSSSYKLSDFARLFSGGYDENGDYDATTVFVGTR